MTATIALAGDTMLGRGVAEALISDRAAPLVAAEVVEQLASADAVVVNLECCISDGGTPFPDPRKRFFFRAPPVAAERLAELGVDAVTLANNHALDYGPEALLDTRRHLEGAGVAAAGAGADDVGAREPLILRCGPLRVRVVAFSDHPAAYSAGPGRPGIAYVDLGHGLPDWVRAAARPGPDCDAVLVTPHWGPNMVSEPRRRVRDAADALVGAGATLVAGHSAHVFHGAADRVLFDLGDFLDDYAVDRELRNDMGILWIVELAPDGPRRIRAVPLALEYCFTRRASEAETDWIERRLRHLCAPFGTDVERSGAEAEVVASVDGRADGHRVPARRSANTCGRLAFERGSRRLDETAGARHRPPGTDDGTAAAHRAGIRGGDRGRDEPRVPVEASRRGGGARGQPARSGEERG